MPLRNTGDNHINCFALGFLPGGRVGERFLFQRTVLWVKGVFSILIALGFSWRVYGGEIALKSGDILKGEIREIRKDAVVWESNSFGSLTIPKFDVLRIETEAALKIRGESKPCYWRGLRASDAFFQCTRGLRSVPYMSIKQVSVYEVHKEMSREFTGKIFASGSQSFGNKEERSWIADTKATMRHTDFRHDSRYLYEVKSIEESAELERYQAGYAFNWFFSPQTYSILRVEQERDDARNIVRSSRLGAGLGYQLWESERTAFSLEAGAEHVDEEESFVIEGSEELGLSEDKFTSARLSSQFRYKLPLNISIYNNNEFNQSADVSDDWKFNTDSGFSVPIGFGIAGDLKVDYQYQNSPPGENKKEDTAVRFGLSYSW